MSLRNLFRPDTELPKGKYFIPDGNQCGILLDRGVRPICILQGLCSGCPVATARGNVNASNIEALMREAPTKNRL